MKKQLFISFVFIFLLVANMNTVYAQCGDALKPLAGKKYTYSVSVNPTGGTFDWFVTTDPHISTATAIPNGTGATTDIILAGTGYNAPATATSSIDITWTSQAVAAANAATPTKYYLVVKYKTDCSNNIKPWRIQPFNLFQIQVENVNSTGGAYADLCRAEYVDALIGDDDKVTYDYGENAFYLKVTANNFTENWTPKIDIATLKGSITAPQTIKSIEWSLNTTFTDVSNFDLTTGIATTAVPDKNGDNSTSGTDEFIYIKVVVKDAGFEGITAQNIAFNLSATDVAANKDVDFDIATCANLSENDNVLQVLKARPAITNPNPTPFLTAN